jgi:hypothetical protein
MIYKCSSFDHTDKVVENPSEETNCSWNPSGDESQTIADAGLRDGAVLTTRSRMRD